MSWKSVTLASGATVLALIATAPATAKSCRATSATHPNESRNPNYRPGAPVRSSVGTGHVLTGTVRASSDCRPIAHARIELFQIAANGRYSNGVTSWAGRATLFSRSDGSFRFESSMPTAYGGNRPHIHVYVTAAGFRPLRTAYYVPAGETNGRFDLVLEPS